MYVETFPTCNILFLHQKQVRRLFKFFFLKLTLFSTKKYFPVIHQKRVRRLFKKNLKICIIFLKNTLLMQWKDVYGLFGLTIFCFLHQKRVRRLL